MGRKDGGLTNDWTHKWASNRRWRRNDEYSGKSNISREEDVGELASGRVTLHVIRTVVEND